MTLHEQYTHRDRYPWPCYHKALPMAVTVRARLDGLHPHPHKGLKPLKPLLGHRSVKDVGDIDRTGSSSDMGIEDNCHVPRKARHQLTGLSALAD